LKGAKMKKIQDEELKKKIEDKLKENNVKIINGKIKLKD
jgi:hypothetical protein